MPMFFFDLDDGSSEPLRNDSGTNLPDLKAARAEAIRALPAMATDELPDGTNHDFRVTVRNNTGAVVFKASLLFRTDFVDQGNVALASDASFSTAN